MPLKNEISQAVLDLISKNKWEQPSQLSAPVPIAENLYPLCKHLFTARARIYLERPTNSLIYQYNRPTEPKAALLNFLWYLLDKPAQREMIERANADPSVGYVRDLDVVEFVGSTCEVKDIHRAVEKVVTVINHFSDKGFMKASLMPLCMINFADMPGKPRKLAVLSYISLTKEGSAYAKTYKPKMMFSEGGVPSEVDDQ